MRMHMIQGSVVLGILGICTAWIGAQGPLARVDAPDGGRVAADRPLERVGDAAVPANVQVGFVDMERVIRTHPLATSKSEEIKTVMKARIEELRAKAEKIRGEESTLDLLTEGSPEWLAKLSQIRVQKAAIEVDQKIIRAEQELKLVEAMKGIYMQAQKVVGEVATERKLLFVAMYSSGDVKGRSQGELIADIVTRPFVWHDASLDITDAVIERLKR